MLGRPQELFPSSGKRPICVVITRVEPNAEDVVQIHSDIGRNRPKRLSGAVDAMRLCLEFASTF